MSEATPLPTPSAEQLAEWRALVERIGRGNRSQVVDWDEGAAAGLVAIYQVLVTQQVRQRLRGAPHAGRARSLASWRSFGGSDRGQLIFRRRRLGDGGWTVTFGTADLLGRPSRTARVLVDLTWAA